MHFCKGRDFLFHKNNGNIIGVVAQVIVRKKPQIYFFSALFFEMLSAKCSKRYCVSVISCHIAKKLQHNRVETTAMFFFSKNSLFCSQLVESIYVVNYHYFTHLLKHKLQCALRALDRYY